MKPPINPDIALRERPFDPEVPFDAAQRLAADSGRLRRKFWPKLKKLAATLPFAEDVLAAYYCAFDGGTPRHVKAALLAAVAYFVLPFDFIPDMLPMLGFTDDAAVLAAALRTVSHYMTPAHREAAREALEKMKADGA